MRRSAMTRSILIQIGLAFVSLLLVSGLIFWLVDLLPGDSAQLILGQNATEEAVAALRLRLGLDEPALQRYLAWLGGALQGEFGQSIIAARPVIDIIRPRMVNSLSLALLALAIYVPVGLGLALLSAAKRGKPTDAAVSVLVLFGMSVPEFVIAIFLMILFAITFPLFPPLALLDAGQSFGQRLHAIFLPALSLSVVMTAYAIRLLRENLIQILNADHVRMAALKGLPRLRILLRHALPGALGPALAVTATNIAWLIGSVVLVEAVFNYPGLGRQLVESLVYKDYPVVQAIALILCATYILCNLLADLAITLVNPKLRRSA